MADRRNDPSVFSEPHMRPAPPAPGSHLPYADPLTPPPSAIDPNQDVLHEPAGPRSAQRIEESVWDEPGLSRELAGAPDASQVTYGRWLAGQKPRWTLARSWGLTALLALAAGPWAVVGTLLTGGSGAWGVVMLVVVGPLTEELMKIAGLMLVVERWPAALRNGSQILLCALAGGLAFAAIENLLYLFVYIPDPSPALAAWRWTVCVAMHALCSFIAGLGARRVWRDVWERRAAPRLTFAYPFLVTAAIVHGAYNGSALLAEQIGWLEL